MNSDDLATLRRALSGDGATARYYKQGINWAQFHAEHQAERESLDRVESFVREADAEIARLRDPDYSPAYQDEYQRLWHEAAARAEAAEADVARLERERDEERVLHDAWRRDSDAYKDRWTAEQAKRWAAEAEVARQAEWIKRVSSTATDAATAADASEARVARLRDGLRPENLARLFHETYESLAPFHGYKTRKDSAVSWDEVPAANKALMIATADTVARALLAEDGAAKVCPNCGRTIRTETCEACAMPDGAA